MRKLYFFCLILLAFAACSKPDTPGPTPPAPPRPVDTSARPGNTQQPPVQIDSTGWHRLNTAGYPFFTDLHFTDTLHGVACGSDGYLYGSRDGGLSWTMVPGIKATGHFFISFFFLNSQQGYCISFTDLAITMDGGQTWKQKPINLPLLQEHWLNLQFVTPSIGYFTSATGTYATTDTGTTWKQVNSKPAAGLVFSDAQNGMIFAEPDSLYQTTDGGLHWMPFAEIPKAQKASNDTYATLFFTDAQHGWMMDAGNVFASADGGASWKIVLAWQTSSSQYYLDFKMLDNQTGWVLSSSKVWKTTDGGGSFAPVYSDSAFTMESLSIVNASHVWASGMIAPAQSVLLKYTR